MRVFTAILLAVLLACTAAIAQVGLPWPGPGMPAASGGGGYTGPCDTGVAGAGGCTVFYGLRAATGALAVSTTKFFDWTCTNGSVFNGTVHSDTNGNASTTDLSTISSDCGSQNVFATTIYEQLHGTANAAAVADGGPGTGLRFFQSSTTCKGLSLCYYGGGTFFGSNHVTATVSISQGWSIATVDCQVATGASNWWLAAKGSVWAVGVATDGNAGMFAGTGVVTATQATCASTSAPHSTIFIGNGSSSAIVVDGTATGSLNPGSAAIANNFNLGSDDTDSTGSQFDGPASEWAFYPIALAAGSSAGQYGKVCNNLRLYWGTGGTC